MPNMRGRGRGGRGRGGRGRGSRGGGGSKDKKGSNGKKKNLL